MTTTHKDALGGMKRLARTALPFVAVMAVVATTSGCHGTPSLRFGPIGSVLDGQEIGVSVGGYPPGSTLTVAECRGTSSIEDCNEASVRTVVTDESGGVHTTLFVDQVFVDGHGNRVDCLEGGLLHCQIVSATVPDFQNQASEFVNIAPVDLDVTPNRDLVEGQRVTIQGQTTAGSARVALCPYDDAFDPTHCDQRTLSVPEVQSDGTFRTEMTVHSVIDNSGDPVDCRYPGRCIVAAFLGDEGLMVEWAPVEFD